MSKILFITTRFPYPIFGGDILRAFDIIKFLSKRNKVDLVCIGKKNEMQKDKLKFCKNIKTFNLNFISRVINIFFSFFKLEPLQNGFFLSNEMKNYIDSVKDNYDVIICHLLRSSQYLPKNFTGKKILDSTDLLSLNYQRSIKQLHIMNPLKYIYIVEKFLVKKFEKKNFSKFNKIVFVSSKDATAAKAEVDNKKIFVVGNSKDFKFNFFHHSKKNNKIIFVGNIRYLPNKMACEDFAKNTLKKINLKYPEIKFHIVGDIGFLDKFFLSRNNNTIVHGKVINLKTVLKNSICGLCNLKISTGFQNKILTYMSYCIPTVVSFNSFVNTKLKKNKEILVFKNEQDLINKIFSLKTNKKLANQLSSKSRMLIVKKYNRNKVFAKYSKIVN